MPWFYSAVDRPTLPPGLQAGAYSQADASPWRLWWGMNYLKAGSWELNCHRTAVVLRSTISALAQVNCFPFGARRAGLTRTIHAGGFSGVADTISDGRLRGEDEGPRSRPYARARSAAWLSISLRRRARVRRMTDRKAPRLRLPVFKVASSPGC
jgi:hypothetical protein